MPFDPRHGSGSIRDPRDAKQDKGHMVNPSRYGQIGKTSPASRGISGKAALKVEKPVPGAKS